MTGQERQEFAVELRDISKTFGAVKANQNVDLWIEKASIHGIIGENGAGKSTLMSILYGFYQADQGQTLINGVEKHILGSDDAIQAGIGMVHQHFMLVDNFTALENIILGAEAHASLPKSLNQAEKKLKEIQEQYGLSVDLHTVNEQLPVGLQQRVEILKALYRGAEILILDEPTGVLTPQEADQLFDILRSLKTQGKTIVLITHKLREIMAITDAVSIMRQGKMVAHVETADTNPEKLAELMVGRKVRLDVNRADYQPGHKLLSVKDLSLQDHQGVTRLDHINLDIHEGEILGIAGISGNGQSELLEVLSGIRSFRQGQIQYKDQELSDKQIGKWRQVDALKMRHQKIAHIPEDRLHRGLVPRFTAAENVMLGYSDNAQFQTNMLLDPHKITDYARDLMQENDVRPGDPDLRMSTFSGGNQQKLIIGRELYHDPDLLLVGQPTRGVDIGAIELIHKQLIALRDQRKALLLVSVELDEILSLSDRILVLFEGKMMGVLPASQANERILGMMMAGIRLSEIDQ